MKIIFRIFLILIIGFFLIYPHKGLCQESIYNLEQANRIAESSLKFAYAYNFDRLMQSIHWELYRAISEEEEKYTVGPWTKEKYIFYMEILHDGYEKNRVGWRSLVNLVGLDGADAIYYIFNHYDEWYQYTRLHSKLNLILPRVEEKEEKIIDKEETNIEKRKG